MNTGLILLGLAAGVLTGMAAGGGTVMVPGLVLLFGIAQHKAQGAVLAAFLITQSVAAIGQWQQGTMEGRLARWMLPAALAGAAAGALLAARTRPAALREIYGWYLIVLGVANWINFHPRVREEYNP
ncbi:MAG TPA: sulfite exporter TauE/SafE family protein [Symbiobacteriaceae bacterium]|nr:sulfite exporter TauE/SafE family protein [Symbiobacteriaceae bacterium]